MNNHRLRIASSLLIAFIIVNIYGNFTGIKNVIANFRLPDFKFGKLFTLNFDQTERVGIKPTPTDKLYSANYVRFNKASGPTPLLPTPSGFAGQAPTSPAVVLTKAGPTKIPTIKTPTKIPTKIPTKVPKPTKAPKPTKVPPPPPITSDLRPGSTMMEIFQEVSKRMCFPPALLMAFQEKESGVFFSKNNPSSTIKIYNTYGWWKTGAGNPCFGLGYHTQTGIVPPDSVMAGVQCRNAVGSPEDIGIMGIFQISQWEQDVSRKNTVSALPNNIDRRVLFDNALIFASITRNRAGQVPSDCNDWPDDVIEMVAEKHHGVCNYNYGGGNTGNYCADVLRLYKQYR